MNTRVVIKREDLYEQVWSEPVTTVGARYGISGNGLAKICRKLEVPVPVRGYWQLHAVGRAPARTPLPPPRRETPSSHRLVLRPAVTVEPSTIQVRVAETLVNPHRLVREAEATLKHHLKQRPSDRVRPAVIVTCLDISVSAKALDRALRIMDALLKTFEARGHRVELTTPEANRVVADAGAKTWISIGSEKVRVELAEQADRVGGVMRPNGQLVLKTPTYGSDHERRSWRDTRTRRLEDSLGEFILAAERIAAARHASELEWQRKKRAEQVAQHRLKVINDIEDRANTWRMCATMDGFLDAVEAKHGASDSLTPTISWLREQVAMHRDQALDITGLRLEPDAR